MAQALVVATLIALLAVALWLALRAWARVPEAPRPLPKPRPSRGGGPGTREPRTPRPQMGAGGAALPRPVPRRAPTQAIGRPLNRDR